MQLSIPGLEEGIIKFIRINSIEIVSMHFSLGKYTCTVLKLTYLRIIIFTLSLIPIRRHNWQCNFFSIIIQ